MSSRTAELASVIMFLATGLGLMCLLLAPFRVPPRAWFGRPRHCPGPPRHPRVLWKILGLLYRPCCGYDLRADEAVDADAPRRDHRCPECGTMLGPGLRLLRSSLHLRLLPLGVLLLATALSARMIGGSVTALVRTIPSDMLLAAELRAGSSVPARLQRELRRRLERSELSPEQTLDMIPLLVRDLATDRIQSNAMRAPRLLARMAPFAVEELRKALRSTDAQQRRRALQLLVSEDAPPTPDLIAAAIASLRSEGPDHRLPANWREVVSYLLRHRDRCEEEIAEALTSPDEAQRFCAALVASRGGWRFEAELLLPTLLARLADNDEWADASEALEALARLGARAIPHLRAAAESTDAQTRTLSTRAIARLEARLDSSRRNAPQNETTRQP